MDYQKLITDAKKQNFSQLPHHSSHGLPQLHPSNIPDFFIFRRSHYFPIVLIYFENRTTFSGCQDAIAKKIRFFFFHLGLLQLIAKYLP